MTNNAGNVVAPKPNVGGGVYAAPLATALPTDSTTSLIVAYVSAGYISDKGVVESDGGNYTKILAWGGDLVKVVRSQFEVTYQFLLMETLGALPNQLTYGATNVTTSAATLSLGNAVSAKVTSLVLPNQAFVFDMLDGIATIRIVVPNGKVTGIGNVTYADGGAAMYDLTVSAFPDSSGVNAYKYMNDGKHL